jgi:4-amino-4-deoxychorismate lyase
MPAEGPLRDREPAGFELIETMRWQPDAGYLRLDRHLARLQGSASALGFSHDRARVEEALARAADHATGALRVRLLLSRGGEVNVSSHPYAPLPAGTVWRLKLAHERLRSTDMLLRHKTSRREVYEAARAEYGADDADEVLLANERGELCEGTITTLFADFGDGILATPRLDCGLLAGVLRGNFLDSGRAREAVFDVSDFKSAKALYVGNSLRGLIPARLA